MTKEQWLGIIRHLLTIAGGFLISKGWLDESDLMEIIGAVITIVGVVWSARSPEKKQAKEIRDAQ